MSTRPRLSDVFVSIIVPVRDASAFIENAIFELDAAACSITKHYEIVLVDDASRDRTVEIIQRLQQEKTNLQLFCLSRQNGIDVALAAGLDHAIGDFVISLNLETDPVSIVNQLWNERPDQHEFVCGVRSDRRTLLSGIFNSWFSKATGVALPRGASWARVMSRRVVNFINQNSDRHLLLSVLPFLSTYEARTVEYGAISRNGGSFGRTEAGAAIVKGITILFAVSVRPLRLLTILALLASTMSLGFAVYVVAVAVLKKQVVEGWVSLALPMAVMFFFISTILGILSEYIYLLTQNSGNRPVYSITRESRSSVLEIHRRLNITGGQNDAGG